MTESVSGLSTADRGNIVNTERLEIQHRTNKARSKGDLLCTRNNLLLLLKGSNRPNSKEVRSICKKMNACMEIVLQVMSDCSAFYLKTGDLQKGTMIVCEMEKVEQMFYTAYEAAQTYMDSNDDDLTSVQVTDLHSRQGSEVTLDNIRQSSSNSLSVENLHCSRETSNTKGHTEASKHETWQNESKDSKYCHQFQAAQVNQIAEAEQQPQALRSPENPVGLFKYSTSVEPRGQYKLKDSPTVNSGAASLGSDLWQLKRIEIPMFTGDKRKYQSWKAAFTACIDRAPATGEYKLLQLRQYLADDALKSIENLGHSTFAYEAAKERLERKYGGRRRQIAINLEELEGFRQIKIGNAKDIEEFADLLEITIINLKESGQDHELGDGSLYIKLQRKLPEHMLAMYHRWLFEHNISGSVLSLRTWVIEESQFQTVASETINGVTGNVTNNATTQSFSIPMHENSHTFFTVPTSTQHVLCPLCEGMHYIWNCRYFVKKTVSNRWKFAKRFHLCFRCLSDGHIGKSCRKSRQCGHNGCQELHHQLLHRLKRQVLDPGTVVGVSTCSNYPNALQCHFSEITAFSTEGKDRPIEEVDRCMEGKERCMKETDF